MNKLIKSWSVWKLAIIRCTINCFVVGGTAYTTSMSGVRWNDMNGDQKFMVLLGVAIVIGSNLQAFLDRTIERIAQGKTPVSTGDTQQFQKP